MTNDAEGSVASLPSHQLGNATNISASDSGVLVSNATKIYGAGKKRCAVLKGLNMTVKNGTIYGLLGASGCGKTTLLSCLVGRRRLNSGDILVLGHEPGSPESGIPGPRVGYMPQELALFGHFSIKETLHYFGRIYNLKTDFVDSQLEFLSKLLDLPPSHRYVGTLSGGQQRRVSFAVALFHEPELLILDEPTVGVDPLLRHSIWNHLVRQSVDHGRTVIVTTHYIEEARQANTIGMMRSGRLLAEDSPENLLRDYNQTSLENVFLELCMKNHENKLTSIVTNSTSCNQVDYKTEQTQKSQGGVDNMVFDESALSNVTETEIAIDPQIHNNCDAVSSRPIEFCSSAPLFSPAICVTTEKSDRSDGSETSSGLQFTGSSNSTASGERQNRPFRVSLPSPHRLVALIRKNYLQTFRNIGIVLFIYLLAPFQATVFSLTLGHDPTGLKLAIVNDELDPSQGRICSSNTTDCTYSMLSCRYLRYIKDNIIQVPYDNVSEALEAGRNGQVWGVIHFGHNFTGEFEIRQEAGDSATLENIIRSRITVNMDSSNQIIYSSIEKWILEGFEDFYKDFMRSCGHEPEAGFIPLEFLDPIYGQNDTPFTEFMAPALIISLVYFMGVSLTAGVFINEKQQGLLDRNLVAGVQMTEVLMSHLVNHFTAMIGQTALVYLVVLLIFSIPCQGNLGLAVFITFLQSFVGMSFGLLIATVCDDEIGALILSQGSFLPLTVISGFGWPIEGMSFYLRYIAYSSPMTYAVESLRSVFNRGWGIEQTDVYVGILISIAWIFALLSLCLIVLHTRKNAS
ncbi:ABC transporter G family member 20-like [Daphnia pulicaria]|uniref:ABC transporter G family member 20-like n=1 Tax=Daphnia pulicaria TaxID=35523 RepID=UPI001EEBE863|nr:ABC transporter G family member 20-like [Daphnia pulicaria]XP_046651594.1 ABC transporter G family member 20-like [Daphnia pulicaria]XP_046651595.1 ABC transporter G family member 20-like [Daphnia pulicaria]